jgi:hypothetical protein
VRTNRPSGSLCFVVSGVVGFGAGLVGSGIVSCSTVVGFGVVGGFGGFGDGSVGSGVVSCSGVVGFGAVGGFAAVGGFGAVPSRIVLPIGS